MGRKAKRAKILARRKRLLGQETVPEVVAPSEIKKEETVINEAPVAGDSKKDDDNKVVVSKEESVEIKATIKEEIPSKANMTRKKDQTRKKTSTRKRQAAKKTIKN